MQEVYGLGSAPVKDEPASTEGAKPIWGSGFQLTDILQCMHKGRLLPLAWERASAAMASMLDESRGWCAENWGNDHGFLIQIVGVVRAT